MAMPFPALWKTPAETPNPVGTVAVRIRRGEAAADAAGLLISNPSNRRLFAPGPPASLIRSCDDRVHLLLIGQREGLTAGSIDN